MTRFYTLPMFLIWFALASCSSDPDTFLTYTSQSNGNNGNIDITRRPPLSDALALNYANSVETIFRARATGARYTREASDTALAGLAAATGAAGAFSYGTSTVAGLGIASAGIVHLQNIFNARVRANAYFDAAARIHATIKDFVSYNLNHVSESDLTPNGWTLVNVVQANVDMVDKVLNGHLPTAQDLILATERMSKEGAKPQATGTTPINNISATSLVPQREGIVQLPAQTTPPASPGTAEVLQRRRRIVNMLEKLGTPGQAVDIIQKKKLPVTGEDWAEVTVCKAILEKAAPIVTGVNPSITSINHYQRTATPDQLLALESAMNAILK